MTTRSKFDENTDELPYTPETLDNLAKQAEDMRCDTLFGVDDAGADPFSEQYYLAALAQLEMAHRNFKLASLWQSHALASLRR